MSLTIHVIEYADKGIRSVEVGYTDPSTKEKETLVWETKAYVKASRLDGINATISIENDLVFREINAYLKTMTDVQHRVIFNAYQQVYSKLGVEHGEVMAVTNFNKSTRAWMQGVVKPIYDQFNYEHLHQWVQRQKTLQPPPKVKSQYASDDPKDTTYLRFEYTELVAMAIATRLMVPIWSAYISYISDVVSSADRESEAAKCLYRSNLMHWEPYKRLLRFVTKSIEAKAKIETLQSAILASTSSEDIPDWLLSNVLVRRVCIVPLEAVADGPNIVTDAYSHVASTLRSNAQRRFAGSVTDRDKKRRERGDQKDSIADSFKPKQSIPDGERVQAAIYLTDYAEQIVQAMNPGIDMAMYQECRRAMNAIESTFIPLEPQITLVQWVMYSVIQPRYLKIITPEEVHTPNGTVFLSGLNSAIVIAQTLLWSWGYRELAALVTAQGRPRDDDDDGLDSFGTARLPNDLVAELATIYPVQIPHRHKSAVDRHSNPGCVSVEYVHSMFRICRDWNIQTGTQLLRETVHIAGTRRMTLPSSLRVMLGRLLLSLYQERKAYRLRTA